MTREDSKVGLDKTQAFGLADWRVDWLARLDWAD